MHHWTLVRSVEETLRTKTLLNVVRDFDGQQMSPHSI